jgi:hypothetical protein
VFPDGLCDKIAYTQNYWQQSLPGQPKSVEDVSMYCYVRQWCHIRRRILDEGIPKKRVARETGIIRQTINKMLTYEKKLHQASCT